MAKQKSRSSRWAEAVAECQAAMEAIQQLEADLSNGLAHLRDLQYEYEEWYDNLNEGGQAGATGEKLTEVIELDIESYLDSPLESWGEVVNAVEMAEGMDLPLGFGRD
jgi:hypothetical protein